RGPAAVPRRPAADQRSPRCGRLAHHPSDPVVRRFVDAGFVLPGKTPTSEFGPLPVTESQARGISRNPGDPGRTPGGSSSGAGAAVAAGMAPIAHAEDGGGPIRIPASCTGLAGLKPTRGLVTNLTVSPQAPPPPAAPPPGARPPGRGPTPRPPRPSPPAPTRPRGGPPPPRRGPSPPRRPWTRPPGCGSVCSPAPRPAG